MRQRPLTRVSEYGETQVRTTCSGVPGVPEFHTKRKLTEDKLTPQDDSFNERVERIAQAVGIEVTTGVLFTSTNKIEFSEKERETMSTSRSSSVDMESARLRRLGKKGGRHVFVIRSFADLCQPLQEANNEKKKKDRQDAVYLLATILKEF